MITTITKVAAIAVISTACASVSRSTVNAVKDNGHDCVAYRNSLSGNVSLIVGYGVASSDYEASDLARVDLAKQIRSEIQSKSVANETENEARVTSSTKTSVDEMLIGLKIARRCSFNGEYESVIVLQRSSLVKDLERSIGLITDKVDQLMKDATTATHNADKFRSTWEARQTITSQYSKVQSDYRVCRAFNGCNGIDLSKLDEMKISTSKKIAEYQFHLTYANSIAESVGSNLTNLLTNDGISTIKDAGAANIAKVTCVSKAFPKVTNYQVAELSCVVTCEVEGKVSVSRQYAAKGMGSDEVEALRSAMSVLRSKT